MQARLVLTGFAVLGLFAAGTLPAVQGGADAPLVAFDRTTVIAMFTGDALPGDLEALAAEHGAAVVDVWGPLNGAVLKAPTADAGQGLLDALLARADVAAAEFDFAYRLHYIPNDPRFFVQWGIRSIKADVAWDTTFGSKGVRVAILDTGADLVHEDLQGAICAGKNFITTTPPQDDNDHGSHTAGIVGAVTDNGKGISGTSQSCLYIAKVCDSGGSCDISKIGSAISWAINPDGNPATDDRVHAVSMSFGGPVPSSSLQLAMSVAWNNGILPVASAGNDFCGPVGYPAAYDQVIAVGALQVPPFVGAVTGLATGQTEIRAVYSNCGLQVELVAPGSAILSTVRNGYNAFDGTSMAAPFVAGVAGLVKAANPALTNAQIRCVMDMTAQDYGLPKRDPEYGYGKVRADLAVAAAPGGASCVQYTLGIGVPSLAPGVPPL